MKYEHGQYNEPTNKELREEAKEKPDSFIVVSANTTPEYFAYLVQEKIIHTSQYGIIMKSKYVEWFESFKRNDVVKYAPFRKFLSLEDATKDAEKWTHRIQFTANDEFPNKSYMQKLEFELRELLGATISLGYVQNESVQMSPTTMRLLIKTINILKTDLKAYENHDSMIQKRYANMDKIIDKQGREVYVPKQKQDAILEELFSKPFDLVDTNIKSLTREEQLLHDIFSTDHEKDGQFELQFETDELKPTVEEQE